MDVYAHSESGWACANGHEFPAVVPVGCPECNALVVCEPVSAGMALSRQLAGAVDRAAALEDALRDTLDLCNAMREYAPTLNLDGERRLRDSVNLLGGQ